jgi:quercetin dioxygenase-like cupin family protein
MKSLIFLSMLAASGYASGPALAGDAAPVKPNLVLKELVQGLPQGSESEIRVMTATFRAGDKTPVHTHGFPVTVYVVEGEFTVEMKDKAPITIKAGEAMVEPPDTVMTGMNRAMAGETKVVVFYVSTAGAPFVTPLK